MIFSKWSESRSRPVPSNQPVGADGSRGDASSLERRTLALGLTGAVVAHLVPPTRWAFGALTTLFHELGHTVAGWLFGHPSIPAFDLTYGGGLTHTGAFQPALAWAVAGALGWGGWTVRDRSRRVVVPVAGLIGFWIVVVLSEWRRETVIALAGAGFEVLMVTIFFYMALSGRGLKRPEIERPLAAFAAFFVLIATATFAWKVGRDRDFLSAYLEGKGGALMNDLEIVALNLHIHTPLNPGVEGLAHLLLVLCTLPLPVAFRAHQRTR